jgi:hypothetical protein
MMIGVPPSKGLNVPFNFGRKRTGSGRGSARRSSGDAKRGSGTKGASAKQRQECSKDEAALPDRDAADAHAALDGGDDSAHEGDARTLRKSDVSFVHLMRPCLRHLTQCRALWTLAHTCRDGTARQQSSTTSRLQTIVWCFVCTCMRVSAVSTFRAAAAGSETRQCRR